jgi:asparagine synthase (glutamine-hydrolysing)
MSGIFGLLDSKRNTQIGPLLARMGTEMSYRDWYVVETHSEEPAGVGLGRVGIGIFNQERQPICNEDGRLMVFLSGEFYNTVQLCRELEAKGHHFRDEGDLELVVRLYQEKGNQFIYDLEGAFVLAIWDCARQELIIANDRFGLYPLFYAHYDGKLVFAPEMKGILCDDGFHRKLDLTALAQYVRFQHLLGKRTFFEGIHLLPNASLLVYDLSTDSCVVRPYWTFADIPYHPEVSFGEAVEEAGWLLRRAVQRMSSDTYRPGVYLSGGLDSRTILGMISRRPIISLTYGTHDCRDVHYARRIARAVGGDHHWFDLPDGEWVREHAAFHLDLTEGFHSWIHAHGISTLPQARQLTDVILTGWDGGTVMGHNDNIEPLQISAVDDAALITRMFYLFNQKYTWPSVTEAEENLLYCEPIHKEIQGRAFDSFRAEMSRYLSYRSDVRGEYFYVRNHCGRLTHNMIKFTRSHVEVRFPFFDYKLFEFLYSVPARVRGHRALYRAVVQRETPRLAFIPYDHDELLPTTNSLLRGGHALTIKLKRRFNRHLWSAFPERPTLYADYEGYLRGELRDWAEGILFDRRTTERGIFEPVSVRSLMDRHLSGFEEWTIGKIAPLITYELMLRRFYDSNHFGDS